jgi:hypothetical protein
VSCTYTQAGDCTYFTVRCPRLFWVHHFNPGAGRLVLLRREHVPAGRAPVGRLYSAAGSRHERRAEILVFVQRVVVD